MGSKYCQKQSMFNKVGCWVGDIFSVSLSVLCILCVHLRFFIFIQLAFHYYMLFRYWEKVLYGCANSEAYLEPSGTSKIELFLWKLLTAKSRFSDNAFLCKWSLHKNHLIICPRSLPNSYLCVTKHRREWKRSL